jgi:hypothetical protein
MNFVVDCSLANPDAAARGLAEIANGVETVQDGRYFFLPSLSNCAM